MVKVQRDALTELIEEQDGRTAKECAAVDAEGVTPECKALVNLLYQCKRGMVGCSMPMEAVCSLS